MGGPTYELSAWGRAQYARRANQQAAQETPANAAQRMAEEERVTALRLLEDYRKSLGEIEDPYSERILSDLINTEAERNAAVAGTSINALRQSAAARGLGGSALEARERFLREAAARETAGAARAINAQARPANAAHQLAIAGLRGQATGNLADIHLGTGFELPESGQGQAVDRGYTNYDWLYGQGFTPAGNAKRGGTAKAVFTSGG